MTLVLKDILTAARDRSPWFFRTRVTDAIVARYLSDAQNELIGAAVRRDPQYLAQNANIVIQLDGSDLPGVVGAGTAGGVPGSTDSDGMFSTDQSTAGSLVEANVTDDGGASVFVTDRVVTTATSTTLQSTGAGRTTNQDAQRVLVITAGTGIGQRRLILSNTADTWTISTGSDGQQWTVLPDTTSLFDVVEPAYQSDDAMSAFTAIPALQTNLGYLVKVDAQGIPFIDFTAPLMATVELGVTVPAMQFPIDGTVWFNNGTPDTNAPLHLTSKSERFRCRRHAVYIENQQVFLTGKQIDWQDVASITLRYVPIAPVFAALTDVFLLPDHARMALIGMAAEFMAIRVASMPDVQIDTAPHAAAAQAATKSFLANVSAAKRPRGMKTRDVW